MAADGKPDVEKMRLITFDPIHNGYIALGEKVGNAFSDGSPSNLFHIKLGVDFME